MKKVILLLVIGMFFISSISALNFDNVKDYDYISKTAKITNAFGFGSELGEAKLISPVYNKIDLNKCEKVFGKENRKFC